MEKTVTLYYNTGLQPGDVLEDNALLDVAFESTKVSANNAIIKQERYIAQIRVEMTVEQVDPIDYARIGETCYWVIGYNMLNDNVAMLSLQMDGITTVGLANIEVVSGWCNRRCVTDDTPFSNTLDEPFSPTEHFKVELGGELRMPDSEYYEEFYDVVLSTFDLAAFNGIKGIASELWESATTQNDEASGGSGATLGVFVPTIPPLNKTTGYYSDIYGSNREGTVPGTAAFIIDKVETALQRCHSLGLDDAIVYAYTIPKEYVTEIEFFTDFSYDFTEWPLHNLVDWITSYVLQASIQTLRCTTKTVDSFLQPVFGTFKNNKVFSGQFQKYSVMSIVSGNSATYDVEDILVNGVEEPSVQYTIGADLRYNGFPIIAPKIYKGQNNTVLFGSVTGGVWQTSPIGVKGVSGYGTTTLNQRQQLFKAVANDAEYLYAAGDPGLKNAIEGIKRVRTRRSAGPVIAFSSAFLDSYASDSSIAAKASFADDKIKEDILPATLDYALQRNAARAQDSVPQLMFSQVPNLQAYLGNRFYEYRVLLSDTDMQRFDRFLTMFGYTVSEPLTADCFKGRQYFNYVKAEGVNIKAEGVSLAIRRLVVSQIEGGVRIWHTAPSQTAFDENPILEV